MDKILLIEMDLRKFVVGKDLGIKLEVGLSDFLSGMIDVNIFYRIDGVLNLNVIICGSIFFNFMELIVFKRF